MSYIGMAGTVAHFPVLRKAMAAMPRESSSSAARRGVRHLHVKLHPVLKETFFLQTKEDDNDPTSRASSRC
jgi:ATP-dependent HslUV protease subunit HslV